MNFSKFNRKLAKKNEAYLQNVRKFHGAVFGGNSIFMRAKMNIFAKIVGYIHFGALKNSIYEKNRHHLDTF